jgi:flagellar basal-body rod protein FlgC
MDPFRLSELSAAGLLAQKARVEAATANLAHLHASSADPAGRYRPVSAVIHAMPGFAAALRGAPALQVQWVPRDVAPRLAYEPGHPHADAGGMVSYPGVDPTQEMLTVTTALRAYEANLACLQATRTLALRALDIGSRG